ncbi:hypothetical protein [Clostridium ganghwense]|uniref:Uncharacterized protein n=1 Tax=Clostridium ganghwense TaxID=312089 RepID=A0ABT4CNI2_9CLOT|nr:hypothetical protein [Clostridium ganghwense]MCY6369554.1 hypothetical protein [Clostridium ganghwense]
MKNNSYTSLKNFSKNIIFKEINMNNILEITPRDILEWLLYNQKIISNESNKLKSEISQLINELNTTNKSSKKVKIKKEIKERKEYINAISKKLDKWAVNKYKNIQDIVKQILKQSIPEAREEEMQNIFIKFEKMLKDKKYSATSLKKIIDINIKAYRKQMIKPYCETNLPILPQNIDNKKEDDEKNIEETIIPTEVLINSPKNSSENLKVNMFYASIVGRDRGNNLSNESFELMLLKSLDYISKFLYGTLQSQITELYKEIENSNNFHYKNIR